MLIPVSFMYHALHHILYIFLTKNTASTNVFCIHVCIIDSIWKLDKAVLDRTSSFWQKTTHNTNVLCLACIFVISHIWLILVDNLFLLCDQCNSSEREEVGTLNLRIKSLML